MKRDYDNPYQEMFTRVTDNPIHWTVKFGNNVKVGHNVVIDENVIIGDNVFIGHNTMIRSNVKIGDKSVIGHLVVIESDTTIGNHVTVQSQCHITKYAVVEDDVFFGPMSLCLNTQHISHGRKFKPVLQGPHIKRGARIGSGAVIMPGIVIGQEAEIGANSTVTKDCEDFWTYVGSPARAVRKIHSDERY